jgi:5,6-dimethylbenzimidazole synthase
MRMGAGPSDPGLYEVIHRRRDVRAEFNGAPVDPVVLTRLLDAAHCAPSVGLSQPWDFVLVTDDATRRAFWEHVQGERQAFADALEGEAAERFAGIKIDGILEASLSLVVTYDPGRGAPNVLGRHAIADAGLYSVCLAIENLWLACTAEGWGMGWVSFYREEFLRTLIGVPEALRPVAWLCLGPVDSLQETPDLERHGWRRRAPLVDAVHLERWERAGAAVADVLAGPGHIGGALSVAHDAATEGGGR